MKGPDLLGRALRFAPRQSKLTTRALGWWERHLAPGDVRRRRLPDDVRIEVRMDYPYEREIWQRPEQFDDVRSTMKLLRPGDRFVDCGANIGLWTLLACRAVGPKGEVISIEPNPEVFGQLRRNLELNRFGERCEAFCCAAGSRSAVAVFDPGGAFHNVGRIDVGHGAGTGPRVEVEVRTLDSLAGRRKLDGVKIDVEGHEIEVLRGAESVLGRDRPWLVIEYNPVESGPFDRWGVHRWLMERGWRLGPLLPGEPGVTSAPTIGSMSAHVNLLYRHGP